MASVNKLESRLAIAEKALADVRRRRKELEQLVEAATKELGQEQARFEDAKERMSLLDHKLETQRQQVRHYQDLAEQAQKEATESSEKIASLAADSRERRCKINGEFGRVVQRLTDILPWQTGERQPASKTKNEEAPEALTERIEQAVGRLLKQSQLPV